MGAADGYYIIHYDHVSELHSRWNLCRTGPFSLELCEAYHQFSIPSIFFYHRHKFPWSRI